MRLESLESCPFPCTSLQEYILQNRGANYLREYEYTTDGEQIEGEEDDEI